MYSTTVKKITVSVSYFPFLFCFCCHHWQVLLYCFYFSFLSIDICNILAVYFPKINYPINNFSPLPSAPKMEGNDAKEKKENTSSVILR